MVWPDRLAPRKLGLKGGLKGSYPRNVYLPYREAPHFRAEKGSFFPPKKSGQEDYLGDLCGLERPKGAGEISRNRIEHESCH